LTHRKSDTTSQIPIMEMKKRKNTKCKENAPYIELMAVQN